MSTITIEAEVAGTIDRYNGRTWHTMPRPVPPGTYEVEEVDSGLLGLVLDEEPDDYVWVDTAALGVAECPFSHGGGDSECGACDDKGWLTPEEQDFIDEMYGGWSY